MVKGSISIKTVKDLPTLDHLLEFFNLNQTDPNDAMNAMFFIAIKLMKDAGFDENQYLEICKIHWENYAKSKGLFS